MKGLRGPDDDPLHSNHVSVEAARLIKAQVDHLKSPISTSGRDRKQLLTLKSDMSTLARQRSPGRQPIFGSLELIEGASLEGLSG